MKQHFSLVCALLFSFIILTACQKSDLPRPEKPEVNIIAIQKELQQVEDRLKAKIIQPDNQTIYYFGEEQDENGNRLVKLTSKEKAKYYRKIFGRTANDECIFQGFYVENDYPQCSVAIASKEKCDSWYVNIKQYDDAMYAWYNINGGFDHIVKIEQGKDTVDILYDETNNVWRKAYFINNALILERIPQNPSKNGKFLTSRCEYNPFDIEDEQEKKNKTLKNFYIFNNQPKTSSDDNVIMYAFTNNKLDLDHSIIWRKQQGYMGRILFKKDINIQELEQGFKQTCFVSH